jgi:hypothetical protein
VLPFGWLWYAEPNAASNAVDYAKFYSRSHDAIVAILTVMVTAVLLLPSESALTLGMAALSPSAFVLP